MTRSPLVTIVNIPVALVHPEGTTAEELADEVLDDDLVCICLACSGGPAPVAADCIKVVSEAGERTDECLPVAPDSERIDLATRKLSHPTPITTRCIRRARLSRSSWAVRSMTNRSGRR